MGHDASNQDLEQLYQSYLEWLVVLLAEHDPVGLVGEENPDEYTAEARKIAPLVASAASADELATKVQSVFVYFFDSPLAGDTSRYLPIAEAMMSKWLELRESPGR